MKSKSKKNDKKSTAIRGQGSTLHRLTSGVRTPSPPDDTPPSTTAAAVVAHDALPPGGHSLTIRIAPKNPGRKSCEPTGNGRLNKEGPEVTGSEPVGSSLVFVEGSDAAPEVVAGQEMKHGFVGVDGSGYNHQSPPTKRMMMMNRETQPSSSSSSAERCNAGVLTDPDCLGPCDPGSSVILEGIVWNESRNGLLVVNVTWRGKTYVGTLMDSTNHNWASPSFKEDSLSSDNHSSSRDEDGVIIIPEGRRLRRCRTTQPSSGVMATTSTASSSTSTTSSSSKISTTRAKCRIQPGDNSVQPDSVNLQLTPNGGGGGGDPGLLCSELHCQRKFKHEAALRNHRFRAHKLTDSIATSSASAMARSIADDSAGNSSAAQSRGPSLLLPAKQRSFDGDEDVSFAYGGKFVKKTEDGARQCMETDGGSVETECPLIKPASGLDNDKIDCFVPSLCSQSTPVVLGNSVPLSSAKLPASTQTEKGAEAPLNSSDCTVSETTAPAGDGVECITVCAARQKVRYGTKKKCKGKLDRVQKNSEIVVSSSGLVSQVFGQSLMSACAVPEHTTAGMFSLQALEDKHSAKRLKTNSGIPVSMLSVSLNRIPTENDPTLARKMASTSETRSDERLQDAETNESSCTSGVDSNVRGLGLDVAKLCITSGFSSYGGREPSAAEASSQSLFVMREAMGRCHLEKNQVNDSNCHPIKVENTGKIHAEKFAKPLPESCQALSGKGQSGSDSQSCSDHAATPSLLVFRASKSCHDKILAPGNVCDGVQKQIGLHSGSSSTFAADSSKSFLDHVGKELITGSHLAYMDKPKTDSTNSAKNQNSIFGARTPAGEGIGNQAVKQKCAAYQNLDQAIADRSAAISATPPGGTALISSGPTPFAKDILCDLNSFANGQKDSPDPKGAVPSRSTIPFAVPPGSRSIPNGSLTRTTPAFVSSMPSLQHMTGSNASSDPQTSRPSTYNTTLPSSLSMSSSSTPDCSFVPYCRTIQCGPATTSHPKQTNKTCVPSPSLASCPLEANTASEVFARRDDRPWTSATVGKSAQHAITNVSCPERSLLKCGGVSLPVHPPPPPPPPPSQPPSTSSSSPTDLYHGVVSYQQKKEKLISTLHSSATKPQSSSSRSLLTGHSVQAACPK